MFGRAFIIIPVIEYTGHCHGRVFTIALCHQRGAPTQLFYVTHFGASATIGRL